MPAPRVFAGVAGVEPQASPTALRQLPLLWGLTALDPSHPSFHWVADHFAGNISRAAANYALDVSAGVPKTGLERLA